VRYDTSTPIYDGSPFKCTHYEHSVTTVDFNNTNGNCRTQAAAVINQHPAFFAFEGASANYIAMSCVLTGPLTRVSVA
jgi:hypothetical protein